MSAERKRLSPDHIGPPVPPTTVLDAALGCLDERFRQVPNGRLEVAWKQPTKGRGDEGDRPARYSITIECLFRPGEQPPQRGSA